MKNVLINDKYVSMERDIKPLHTPTHLKSIWHKLDQLSCVREGLRSAYSIATSGIIFFLFQLIKQTLNENVKIQYLKQAYISYILY